MELNKYKYTEETLIKNIHKLNLVEIYKYQDISFNFIVKYILNQDYQIMREETDICIDDVLLYNSHLESEFEVFLKKKYRFCNKNIDFVTKI